MRDIFVVLINRAAEALTAFWALIRCVVGSAFYLVGFIVLVASLWSLTDHVTDWLFINVVLHGLVGVLGPLDFLKLPWHLGVPLGVIASWLLVFAGFKTMPAGHVDIDDFSHSPTAVTLVYTTVGVAFAVVLVYVVWGVVSLAKLVTS